ncbi:unnamed protein product [Linum trigynum]|uniref:Uncharacterized protein n=1 Tax=Linum trigynum TaxID=586398 RepID=A0AAV2DVF7_9ROSI
MLWMDERSIGGIIYWRAQTRNIRCYPDVPTRNGARGLRLAKVKNEEVRKHRLVVRGIPRQGMEAWSSSTAASTPHEPPRQTVIQRMSPEEVARCRAQGLCFHCDERFTIGPRCANNNLLLMIGACGEGEEGTFIEEEDQPRGQGCAQGGRDITRSGHCSISQKTGLVYL